MWNVCTDTGYMFCLTPTPGAENKGLMFATLEDSENYEAPEGIVINEATRDFTGLVFYIIATGILYAAVCIILLKIMSANLLKPFQLLRMV